MFKKSIRQLAIKLRIKSYGIKYQQPMVSIVSVNYDQPIVTCEMLASLRKVTYLILKY
jgi:hypothetical protein